MAYRKKTIRNSKLLNTKRKIKLWWFRSICILSVCVVLFFAYSFYFNQALFPNLVTSNIDSLSHKLNYVIKEIYVEGEDDHCSINQGAYLNKYKGTPTLLVPVGNIKHDLEKIDCVKKISVTRMLPSKLKVTIKANIPIAIWQNKGRFFFVTNNGGILKIRNSKNVNKFIIIVGDSAPSKTPELLAILEKNESLYTKIVSAIWVGDRRWNIIFDNGTELLLPENNYIAAWDKFTKLSKENDAFKSFSYRVVDFRVKNRIYAK